MTYTYCCVYSTKTPDDGQKTCPKHIEFYSKNKFEKLVHLVGFIIRIYNDASSSECKISDRLFSPPSSLLKKNTHGIVSCYWSGRSLKLNIRLYLKYRLRMQGTLNLFHRSSYQYGFKREKFAVVLYYIFSLCIVKVSCIIVEVLSVIK